MPNIGGREISLPNPGSTVTITINTDIPHTLAAWTASQIETVNISGTPMDGQLLTCIITNDATLGRVITFGTGLSSPGTLLGVISKRSVVDFIAYGGMFYERSRTVGF